MQAAAMASDERILFFIWFPPSGSNPVAKSTALAFGRLASELRSSIATVNSF
jgi:hypothetical protein